MTPITMWWHEARFQLSRNSVRILLLLAAVLSAASVYLGHVEVHQQRTTIDQLKALDVQVAKILFQSINSDKTCNLPLAKNCCYCNSI